MWTEIIKTKDLEDGRHIQMTREGLEFVVYAYSADWMAKEVLNVEEYTTRGAKSPREIQNRRRAARALSLGFFDSFE